MPYCRKGEKANITFKLGEREGVFITENTPVDVESYQKRVNASENFRPEGIGIRFYSPNNRITLDFPVRDFIIYPVQNFDYGDDYEGISWWSCEADDFNRQADGSLSGPGIATRTLTFTNQRCPTPLKAKCYIEVLHAGNIIFRDQGDCPASISIFCGDCPEGFLRCETFNFPGYCCAECDPLAQDIKSISETLKQLNKGSVYRG